MAAAPPVPMDVKPLQKSEQPERQETSIQELPELRPQKGVRSPDLGLKHAATVAAVPKVDYRWPAATAAAAAAAAASAASAAASAASTASAAPATGCATSPHAANAHLIHHQLIQVHSLLQDIGVDARHHPEPQISVPPMAVKPEKS